MRAPVVPPGSHGGRVVVSTRHATSPGASRCTSRAKQFGAADERVPQCLVPHGFYRGAVTTTKPATDDDMLALERQVCFALSVAARNVVAVYRPVLEPLGLTHPQYPVSYTHLTLPTKA